MDLTLPQRLYLLGYHLDKGRFDVVSTPYRGSLLRAAALTELTAAGLLRDRGDHAERVSDRWPGDPFLAEVLRDVPTSAPRRWTSLVHLGAHTAEAAVREQCAAAGAVRVTGGRVLGVIPTRRVTLARPEQVRLLRERVRDAVFAGHEPAAVPFEEAALAAIAAEGDVGTVFTWAERRQYRWAIAALQRHFDATVPGVRYAIQVAVAAGRTSAAT